MFDQKKHLTIVIIFSLQEIRPTREHVLLQLLRVWTKNSDVTLFSWKLKKWRVRPSKVHETSCFFFSHKRSLLTRFDHASEITTYEITSCFSLIKNQWGIFLLRHNSTREIDANIRRIQHRHLYATNNAFTSCFSNKTYFKTEDRFEKEIDS